MKKSLPTREETSFLFLVVLIIFYNFAHCNF